MNTDCSRDDEVQRLQMRFNTLKIDKKVSQAAFAREYAMPGGASMITQHLKSTRPVSLEQALVYARGFGCPLSDISPRLAKLVADGQATSNPISQLRELTPQVVANSGSSLARFFDKLPQDTSIRNEVFIRCLDIIGEYLPSSNSVPSRMHVEHVSPETPSVTRPV